MNALEQTNMLMVDLNVSSTTYRIDDQTTLKTRPMLEETRVDVIGLTIA